MSNNKILRVLKERLPIPEKDYRVVRQSIPRMCHDAVIYLPMQDKMVLAVRKQEPAKGKSWPFGGGQKIGFPQKESLARLVKGESGICIEDVEPFGALLDMFWSTGPSEMSLEGVPVHDIAQYYTAIGRGDINPNNLHDFRLVSPEEYLSGRHKMEFWTQVGMDRAANRFWSMRIEELPFPEYCLDSKPFYKE